MMIYELWNTRTRNLVGSYENEAAALDAVRDAESINGRAYAERLALASEDADGQTTSIARGADLVDRARHAGANRIATTETVADQTRSA